MVFTFGGAFTMFTYLRPYLEHIKGITVTQITLCFLSLGCAGFLGGPFGSALTRKHVVLLLRLIPLVMGTITIGLLFSTNTIVGTLILLALWGTMNTALSIGWMGWMAQNVSDQPEAAGSLMVAFIQGAILLGATLGGEAFDVENITGTFICSIILSALACLFIGSGKKLLNTTT